MSSRLLRQVAVILVVLGTAMTFDANAQEAAMPQENAVITFARDFSANDPAIMERVMELVSEPPKNEDTIGFYGSESYPEQSRLYLAIVNLLAETEVLDSVEDKYTYELLSLWQEKGLIELDRLPETAKALFRPIIGELDMDDEQQLKTYRDFAWKNYAAATKELEQYFASRGKVLLSIDATDGDTLFFALVDPRIAERWRDKALAEHEGYRAGVRSPMWDVFWVHLSYATRGLLVDGDGYPPGTPRRRNAIPFAE